MDRCSSGRTFTKSTNADPFTTWQLRYLLFGSNSARSIALRLDEGIGPLAAETETPSVREEELAKAFAACGLEPVPARR